MNLTASQRALPDWQQLSTSPAPVGTTAVAFTAAAIAPAPAAPLAGKSPPAVVAAAVASPGDEARLRGASKAGDASWVLNATTSSMLERIDATRDAKVCFDRTSSRPLLPRLVRAVSFPSRCCATAGKPRQGRRQGEARRGVGDPLARLSVGSFRFAVSASVPRLRWVHSSGRKTPTSMAVVGGAPTHIIVGNDSLG